MALIPDAPYIRSAERFGMDFVANYMYGYDDSIDCEEDEDDESDLD